MQLYTQGKMSYTLNTITQVNRALHLTAHCRCWTCEHVSRRQHLNKNWAYVGGGLTNSCSGACGKSLAGYCKQQWISLALQKGNNPTCDL